MSIGKVAKTYESISVAIIFYYRPQNKYSFIALAGALDTRPLSFSYDLYFPARRGDLLKTIKSKSVLYHKIFVCISIMSAQAKESKETIKEIKDLNINNLIIVAGGPHVTGVSEDTLSWGADYSIIGEGEITLPELISQIMLKGNISLIKGLSYYDNNDKVIFTGHQPYVDLSDWHPFSISHNKVGPLELTRGCYYNCRFCQTPAIFGNRARHRSPEKIFSVVEWMKKKHFNDIRFITPNAFGYYSQQPGKVNIERIFFLLDGIKRINKHCRIFLGTFPSEVRPEYVTPESLNLIKTFAVNRNIVIGAQTGSNNMLRRIRRGHTVEDIYKAVILTTNAGLKPFVDFILGLPEEDSDDINQSMKMIDNIVALGAKIHLHSFMPLVQTDLNNHFQREIDSLVKQKINKLISAGFAYGSWKKQASM
jgi:B12-binding domain/radical SAM domain protein